MSQNQPFVSTGSNRLEEMTGDNKKLRGPGFWLLFCVLFLGAGFLFGWIFGTMIRGGGDSMSSQPEAPSPAAPAAPETPEPAPQPPVGEPAPEPQILEPAPTPLPPQEAPEPVDNLQNVTALPEKKPVTIGGTDIYLDEDGVWRNLNRGEADETRAAASAPLNRLGGHASQSTNIPPAPITSGPLPSNGAGQNGLNTNDLGGMMNMVSGLLSQGQSQSGQDMGDLGGMMNMVSGLLSQSSGQSSQDMGDLSGMMNMVSGLLSSAGGQSGSNSNDLSGLMNMISSLSGSEGGGLMSSPAQGGLAPQQTNLGQDGLASDDPIHEIRRRMTLQAQEDERRTKELRAQIQKSQSKDRFESLDGFERFDPKDAAKIKSPWERFDDPR